MAQNITLMGASYQAVPAVTLPKTGGGTASFTDVTGTTALAADVASGKYFFTASGTLTLGTATGGGGTITLSGTGSSSNCYVQLNQTGTKYYTAGDTIDFASGDELYIYCKAGRSGGTISVNGTDVASDPTSAVTYTLELKSFDVSVQLNFGMNAATVAVTLPSKSITTNGTHDVADYAIADVNVSGGGSTRELIVPQQTVTPSSYQVVLSNVSGLFIGGHYVVTYDGTEYVFSAGSLWGGNRIVAGEQTLVYDHTTRNDEIAPFALDETFNDVNRKITLDAKDNSSHTIKVERIDSDGVETTNIAPQQTITSDSSYQATIANITAQLVDGDFYLVTYDGVEYMVTAAVLWGNTTLIGDDLIIWSGDQPDNVSYPFAIYNQNQGLSCYTIDANASHTIKVDHIDSIPEYTSTTTKSITANGTYTAVDDGAYGYSSVTVNVSGGGGTPRTSADLTVSGATVTAPAGVYASDASKSVASMTLPTAASATSSGTSKATITPGSSAQYINIPTGYNGTASYYTISATSGSSKNVQVAQSTSRATSSTYTSVCSLTCSTAGTYDVYWDCFRSSTGGTNGSQLYVGGSAYGSANTAFTNHIQTNHLTGVSLTKNQTVAVYARSRGSNYYAYCGQLTIVQTA